LCEYTIRAKPAKVRQHDVIDEIHLCRDRGRFAITPIQ